MNNCLTEVVIPIHFVSGVVTDYSGSYTASIFIITGFSGLALVLLIVHITLLRKSGMYEVTK